MDVTRIAILGVALVAGAAAFFLIMAGGSEEAPIQIIEAPKEESIRVLVSSREITRGQRINDEDTKWIAWPKKALHPEFITDKTPERRDELIGSVARTLVVEGEPIIDQKIVKAGSSGFMAAILAPGMRAVTMRVSPETASGGFILPGDRVDIHYTESSDQNDDSTNLTTIKENVKVLAVDTIYSDRSADAAIQGNNVTLEMTPEDAEFFIVAQNSRGQLQLTLRSIFEPTDQIVSDKRKGAVEVIRYGRS